MPPFPTENEADQSAPYLQQSSSPNNLTTGFSGMITASEKCCSLNIDSKEGIALIS